MKDRPKLGRGLRDVSQFFLSGSSQGGQHHDENLSPAPRARSVSILSPSSPLIQSFFTANLALEMARHRIEVRVWDYLESDEIRVRTLMRSLLDNQPPEPEEPARILLYGLPRIEVQDGMSGYFFVGEDKVEKAPDAGGPEDDRSILVNACPHLDFILNSMPVDHAVIITRTDEMSLLQCYAFIKVMHKRSRDSDIGVVFDGGEDRDSQQVFGRLAGYVHSRLGRSIGFLGVLEHDETMERSICDERPLVLQTGTSASRDAITGICSRFIEGRLLQERGADS